MRTDRQMRIALAQSTISPRRCSLQFQSPKSLQTLRALDLGACSKNQTKVLLVVPKFFPKTPRLGIDP